jgi:hypothetical protein
VKAASRPSPAMAQQPTSVANPFIRPSRTGRDLIFTIERK